MERSPVKVEEALTIMPTVLVGRMALTPIYCQLLAWPDKAGSGRFRLVATVSEEAAVPYKAMLPLPMILPATDNCSLGVVVAPIPVLPVGSIKKYWVLVPMVNSPAKVVVPMPTRPSLASI